MRKRFGLALLLPLLLLIFHFIFVFLPPYMKDELYYYLALPHLWELTGKIKPFFWFVPSHFPPLFMWIYYIISPAHYVITHIIGFASLIFFLVFLYLYQQKNLGENFPANFLVASVLFLLIPVVFQISATAYVGIWVAAFIMAYLYFFSMYIKEGDNLSLFLSALMLSLAVFTKYTGLTVSVIIFLFSILQLRGDRRRQLRYMFFTPLIILIPNLPWMIANYLDTGNPIYPLLGKIFTFKRVEHYNPAAIKFDTYISPLMARRFLYHENWLQIISAPLRIFFYGKEGNPALFDGSLAAYLLIFLPFLRKSHRHLYSYVLMAGIYIIIAFFSTPLRARYLIPVIPLLLIPATEGFLQLFTRHRILAMTLMALTLILPINYIMTRTARTDLFPYVSGNMEKEYWLKKHVIYFDAYQWINSNNQCKKVFLYFNGRRGYYIDRPFMFEPETNVEGSWFYYGLKHDTVEPFKFYKIDCLFISKPFFSIFVRNNFKEEELKKLPGYFESHFSLIYNDNLVEIWKLR